MKIAINGEILEVTGGSGLPEGTVAVKPLTKAEYDALTDEDKQSDTLYAITDDNEGGSSSGGSHEEVYSTEEMRIGKWIDGKPLYRRVVTFDVSVYGTWTKAIDLIDGIELQMGTFNLRRTPYGDFVIGGVVDASHDVQLSLSYNVSGGHMPQGLCYRSGHPSMVGKCICVLEYTKTTE